MIHVIPETYFFHSDVAATIIEAAGQGLSHVRVSLDLNLSRKNFEIKNTTLVLNDIAFVEINKLESIASSPGKIFMLRDNELKPLETRAGGYYKLVPTETAPILEINGIKMHRSGAIDPLLDARLKAELVVRPHDFVLDTCAGLGYSAVYALKQGAEKIISVEKSREVLNLRQFNPWFKKYDKKIQLVHGDITEVITELKQASFHCIIHDPPRFTSASGMLYSRKFYGELFRVMAKGARLFHYTGNPGRIRYQDRFIKNTIKRLTASGFENPEFKENLQGIYARKNKA